MTLWLYPRLLWNPYEDVDALIVEFCDKVYGDASEYMQEYYALLHTGWEIGAETILDAFNAEYYMYKGPWYSFLYFLDVETEDGTNVLEGLAELLTKAYEAADDKAKEFIRYPYEIFQDWESLI